MKQGLQEWIIGFYEVLESGEKKNVSMPIWKSYETKPNDSVKEKSVTAMCLFQAMADKQNITLKLRKKPKS